MTFFAACLAISGRSEEQRKNGLTFCSVPEKSRYQSCLCLKMGKYKIHTETQMEKRAKVNLIENIFTIF